MITIENFKELAKKVIEKLEGGYYHPNMLKKNPSKFKGYETSGETMYGLDRHAGHDIYYSTPRKAKGVFDNLKYIDNGSYRYKSDAAKNFWTAIDNANAKNNWEWGNMGGGIKPELIDSVSKIMYPQFNDNSRRYLSKASQDLIAKDDRLLFNFIYATWNGQGWFRKFATDFNSKVASGERNLDNLVKYTIDLRTKEGLNKGDRPNSLIKQGGEKIAEFIDELKNKSKTIFNFANQSIKSYPIVDFLLTLVVVMSGYYLVKTIRKK